MYPTRINKLRNFLLRRLTFSFTEYSGAIIMGKPSVSYCLGKGHRPAHTYNGKRWNNVIISKSYMEGY